MLKVWSIIPGFNFYCFYLEIVAKIKLKLET